MMDVFHTDVAMSRLKRLRLTPVRLGERLGTKLTGGRERRGRQREKETGTETLRDKERKRQTKRDRVKMTCLPPYTKYCVTSFHKY